MSSDLTPWEGSTDARRAMLEGKASELVLDYALCRTFQLNIHHVSLKPFGRTLPFLLAKTSL